MKRFKPDELGASGGESNIRPSFTGKSAQRRYSKAVAAIFAVIVLHFVSQLIFFQDEKISLKTDAVSHRSVEIEFENELPRAEIKTESAAAAKKPEAETMPETVSPVVQPGEQKSAASRVLIKKKETRESKAERLRRAEKILTGI
ncbi:MAG TPA: hypothetical protein VK400_18415 [Pyrinomonadaceae bacterium]|nr:hypothetical protein [Pyrinomonadaceae bacterium]